MKTFYLHRSSRILPSRRELWDLTNVALTEGATALSPESVAAALWISRQRGKWTGRALELLYVVVALILNTLFAAIPCTSRRTVGNLDDGQLYTAWSLTWLTLRATWHRRKTEKT